MIPDWAAGTQTVTLWTLLMHANLTTWRLAEQVRSEEAYAAFIARVLDETLAMARPLGLLDSLIVRAGNDTIVVVTVYDAAENAAAAWSRARSLIAERYGHELEFVSITTGRADDMPQLTDPE